MIFTWRHIKRLLFENDYHIKGILTRRKRRLEFYEFRRKFKELCKRTSLNEKCYERIYELETYGVDYSVISELLSIYSDYIVTNDFLPNEYKLICLDKTVGYNLIGNHYIYYNEFYELWCLWKDAPFWKDYEVWKKLNLMKDDFT